MPCDQLALIRDPRCLRRGVGHSAKSDDSGSTRRSKGRRASDRPSSVKMRRSTSALSPSTCSNNRHARSSSSGGRLSVTASSARTASTRLLQIQSSLRASVISEVSQLGDSSHGGSCSIYGCAESGMAEIKNGVVLPQADPLICHRPGAGSAAAVTLRTARSEGVRTARSSLVRRRDPVCRSHRARRGNRSSGAPDSKAWHSPTRMAS